MEEVKRTGARPPEASDADKRVARAQQSYDLGAIGWNSIDASGAPEETAAMARAVLD
jgi:uncharacterized protein